MADVDLNALGQAIDSTWGRSSTPKTASYSVKLTMLAPDRLQLSFAAIVNFANEKQMVEMKRAYQAEADGVVAEVIKRVKEIYKDLTGSALALKLSKESVSDSLEIINMNAHNAKRTAYYRRKAVVEVG